MFISTGEVMSTLAKLIELVKLIARLKLNALRRSTFAENGEEGGVWVDSGPQGLTMPNLRTRHTLEPLAWHWSH